MDTFIAWVAGGLAIGMLILLVKYAAFINTYPKDIAARLEKEKSDKDKEEP